ncbi:MAG: UvrD-helicase domain-containing protein, partial [Ignavibacteria bacterium]|nr:UvrD-helicase domain-containing protein [Ignavibacteria bacterium]
MNIRPMSEHPPGSILDSLNPQQREAATSIEGPVMIVAGAGSGKTRVLTFRIAHLIHSGIQPGSILALTFTNKAAGEMRARIGELLGDAARHIWAGTFHSVFARILRKECHHLGYERNFSIYDTDDSLSVIKGIMGDNGIPMQEYHPRAIQARISRVKNQMKRPSEFHAGADDIIGEKAAIVYRAYDRALKKQNALDFDDLLLQPLELFRRHPAELEKYQYRFRHLLVDEYQDTNRVQYSLLRLLAAGHRNICVVGDDAQSIYSFRGADIRNILEFEKDYSPCRVFRLEQNYRSTGTILGAANSLISRNPDQIPKKLWTENEVGDPVHLVRCSDEREEAYRIVQVIEEESRERKRDLRDFAVLYRTNAQSRMIEDSMRRSGIPYIIVGSVAFYRRKEIKDVLGYLSLVANPSDDRSFLRVINLPTRGIGKVTLGKVAALAEREGIPMLYALASPLLEKRVSGQTLRKLTGFASMILKYRGLKGTMSISELARAIIDETGILALLKEEGTPDSLTRRENIQELVSALFEFNQHHPDAMLEDFLEEVALVSEVDQADFNRNAVTLMTVHAAKGLEFPVVFVAGLEEGMFPINGALETDREIEEERRLMYVGMT